MNNPDNTLQQTQQPATKEAKTENVNSRSRKLQGNYMVYVFAVVIALCWLGWNFSSSKPSKSAQEKKTNENMAGVTTDSQFAPEVSKSAIDEQQRQIKELTEQLREISNKMTEIQTNLSEKAASISPDAAILDALRARLDSIESGQKNSSQQPGSADSGLSNISSGNEITTTNFSYQDEITSAAVKTTKDYVPPGTFVSAVLLSGADTNAGVHGQTDTVPIVMKLLDNGILPNGEHSRLKGCFVTAASYGDASSERGQIRLQRLSCVRKDKTALDVSVEGTINDMGGSDGIRGHVVMRNQKIIWNAGFSGFLSGIGSALQQTVSKQSTTPLGIATSAIPSQKSFEYGAYGGANTALGKLADYYIKLADMYHPIVQIQAGSKVNVVFLKGFFLTEGNTANGVVNSTLNNNNSNSKGFVGEGVGQSVQEAHLGDSAETQ